MRSSRSLHCSKIIGGPPWRALVRVPEVIDDQSTRKAGYGFTGISEPGLPIVREHGRSMTSRLPRANYLVSTLVARLSFVAIQTIALISGLALVAVRAVAIRGNPLFQLFDLEVKFLHGVCTPSLVEVIHIVDRTTRELQLKNTSRTSPQFEIRTTY